MNSNCQETELIICEIRERGEYLLDEFEKLSSDEKAALMSDIESIKASQQQVFEALEEIRMRGRKLVECRPPCRLLQLLS